MSNLKPALQEATLAVAEVERKKREKRKRQSLCNKGRNGNALTCLPNMDGLSIYCHCLEMLVLYSCYVAIHFISMQLFLSYKLCFCLKI
jgi:hypothetical protein